MQCTFIVQFAMINFSQLLFFFLLTYRILMLYQFTKTPYRLLSIVCLAETLSMMSFAAWPLFLVTLQPIWGLSNFAVGGISGAYFIGYVCATPILVGLTDLIDAKKIFIFSCLLAAAGAIAFGLFAQGFWSAALSWALVGAGMAGTYMPGLQILNARLGYIHRLKLLPYYTVSFGIGTGMSFFIIGWLYDVVGWQSAFFVAAGASLLAGLIIFAFIIPCNPSDNEQQTRRHPLDFRPAFKNRAAFKYIFSYGAHGFELFAFRGWLFAYLIFAASYHNLDFDGLTLSVIISSFTLLGMVASVLGARYALKYNRPTMISRYALFSFLIAVLLSLSGFINFYLVLFLALFYNITIMLDSASLTAGTVAEADASNRGAILAVHTIFGFGGGALGAPVSGFVLDLVGGETSALAWSAAIAVMGLGSALVWLIMHKANKNKDISQANPQE